MNKMSKKEADKIVLEFYDFECRARRMARLKVGAMLILLFTAVVGIFYVTSAVDGFVYNYYGVEK